MGAEKSWFDGLAHGLRVAAGGGAAVRFGVVLLRQGGWNARVLHRFHVQLRLEGIPQPPFQRSAILTSLQSWWRLLRAMPSLAEDQGAEWEHRLRSLHEEIRHASGGNPGPRKLLTDPETRELQRALLRRFFQARLRLDLPAPADAFVRYRHSSEALRDFFDFCATAGRLISREEVERAMGDFAKQVQEYRVMHAGQNPPQGYFHDPSHVSHQFWTQTSRVSQPGRLLTQVYWGKANPQRVIEGVALPLWVRRLIEEQVFPPRDLSRQSLRAMLTYETCLQGVRLLARACTGLEGVPESPKLARLLQDALGDLLRGARAFATGWRAGHLHLRSPHVEAHRAQQT